MDDMIEQAAIKAIANPRAQFDPPDLPPIIAVDETERGWRGLTLDGMLLHVEPANGAPIKIPFGEQLAIRRKGELIGYRGVPEHTSPELIDNYLRCVIATRTAMTEERSSSALVAIENAMTFAPTLAAYYNRGMVLLQQGYWREGFVDYAYAMEYPGSAFMRPQYSACVGFGLSRWRGEDLRGKRLLLIHDHGFGDSIMMLRYVSVLKAMGADVQLWLPPELERLGAQLAPVVHGPAEADYFCSLLFLLQMLQQTPDVIPLQPYLAVDSTLIGKYQRALGYCNRHTIGVAWHAGNTGDGDYPRNMQLAQLVKALPDVRLISVQHQSEDEARLCGVEVYSFEDFAECAALMLACDEIITIDTAAVHLAGAIGHPNIKLLLSHWHSWRWLSPLYATVQIRKQPVPGDWAGALAQL